MCACIARKKSELLQLAAQFGIELDQRPGNTKARGPGLPGDAPAMREDHNVEPLCHFGREQRLPNIGACRFTDEIILKGPVIDCNLAFSGTQKYPRSRGLAATSS